MKVLVAFASVEGHTRKVARFIEEQLRTSEHEVSVCDLTIESSVPPIAQYDKVVLAASVHERRHPETFEVFLAGQKTSLSGARSLLISVSLKAAFEDGLEEAQDYVDELKLRTGFEPERDLLVAGAVASSSYDYFQSQVVRHVLLGQHSHEPAEEEQEFTDWDGLSKAVQDFTAA